ncbi:MAG: hypothetical protein LQ342_005460 [Letrouitia transgressa]|nr:MAG: hypothetical protein LQ342_005460 [Letrouitia transgressa]
MYTFSLILTTLISLTSAKSIYSRHSDPVSPATFGLIALRSASPIHFGSIDASGYAFYIGKETVSYCPEQVGDACPPGNQTIITYFNGTASMDVLVPGGQRVFVAPNGALGYTVPHSSAIPEGALTEGFVYEPPQSENTVGYFSFTGCGATGFLACPCGQEPGVYQIFANVRGAHLGNDCLGFNAGTYGYEGIAAWEYT